MIFMKYMLFVMCFGFFACGVGMVLYDIFLAYELNRILGRGEQADDIATGATSGTTQDTAAQDVAIQGTKSAGKIQAATATRRVRREIRLHAAAKMLIVGAIMGLAGSSILVVPDGKAAVRVSQISGVRPGTLYAGTHFITPLIDRAELYDIRDRIFSTAAMEVRNENLEVLTVEAREGLSVGLAVTVRYRIDPRKLDYIQANLPQPVDQEIVAPVVLSAFRELGPNYIVRDLFSVKREEFRQRAAQAITTRLAGDAIVVKEVLIRKVELPEEYAKGLEDLLLKEQEDDRTLVDVAIEQKRIQIITAQAEAAKIRDVEHAEAGAQAQVIMAKAQSDAMQYTLPLKQKQIEQSRLEAEAHKEATIQDAEAAAQAKVIDSKAQEQREDMLAASAANRIRLTSQAEAEQMQLQAAALKDNPLLVQLTIAQRLSDRVQIMMVPTDGKFFFANDVLKLAMAMDGKTDSAAGQSNSLGDPSANALAKR